jgi:hypothetical protein
LNKLSNWATVGDLKRWLNQFDDSNVLAIDSDDGMLRIEEDFRYVEGFIDPMDSLGRVRIEDFEPYLLEEQEDGDIL